MKIVTPEKFGSDGDAERIDWHDSATVLFKVDRSLQKTGLELWVLDTLDPEGRALIKVEKTPFAETVDRMKQLVVHHIDGNPYNNDLDNLLFVDLKGNPRGKKKFFHDDPPCSATLDENDRCPQCGFSPDQQSLGVRLEEL